MSGQWQPISPSEATQHPLYGIKGWLLVFLVGNLIGLIWIWAPINSIAMDYKMSISDVLSLDAPVIALIRFDLYFEFALLVVTIFLILTKARYFRQITIVGRLALWPVLGAVAISLGLSETGKAWAASFVPWAVSCAVWVTYLQRSKRVRVTFEHCVRGDDPIVLTKPATVSMPQGPATTVAPATTRFEETSTATKTKPAGIDLPQRSLSSQAPIATAIQMDEDAIYATVADELESGKTDKGLWTRLFAECGGDENQTKVQYIKRRAEKLMAAEVARRELFAIQEAERQRQEALRAEQAEQSRRRNAGLADSGLLAAVLEGNWSTACQILESGVSPFGSSDDGISLIDLANRRGDRQMVDLLKAHQMKSFGPGVVEALNKFHAGAVLTLNEVCLLAETAAKYADFVMMRSDGNGYTLLHWCGRLGLDKFADVLLDLGADAAALNNDGKPAHLLTRSTALANRLEAAANAAPSAV